MFGINKTTRYFFKKPKPQGFSTVKLENVTSLSLTIYCRSSWVVAHRGSSPPDRTQAFRILPSSNSSIIMCCFQFCLREGREGAFEMYVFFQLPLIESDTFLLTFPGPALLRNPGNSFSGYLGRGNRLGEHPINPCYTCIREGFPGSSVGKESACNAWDTGDSGSIPESGRSPGGGHGNPLQYSCLKNLMNRGAWQATVHTVEKSNNFAKVSYLVSSKGIRIQIQLICLWYPWS